MSCKPQGNWGFLKEIEAQNGLVTYPGLTAGEWQKLGSEHRSTGVYHPAPPTHPGATPPLESESEPHPQSPMVTSAHSVHSSTVAEHLLCSDHMSGFPGPRTRPSPGH